MNLARLTPVADALAMATPPLAWVVFQDETKTRGPLAFYVLQGLLVAYLGVRLCGWGTAVAGFAMFVGLQQAACGLLFEPMGGHLCDDGTGFPFALFTAFVLMLAIWFDTEWRKS